MVNRDDSVASRYRHPPTTPVGYTSKSSDREKLGGRNEIGENWPMGGQRQASSKKSSLMPASRKAAAARNSRNSARVSARSSRNFGSHARESAAESCTVDGKKRRTKKKMEGKGVVGTWRGDRKSFRSTAGHGEGREFNYE